MGAAVARRRREERAGSLIPAPVRAVRVLPDVPAIDKEFDYLVPEVLGDQVRVGTLVRIDLHGRRVGGWVVEDGVDPPAGIALKPLAKVTGWGPPADVIELARWAAFRWAGRAAALLRAASPDRAVRHLPRAPRSAPGPGADASVSVSAVGRDPAIAEALAGGTNVLRWPPATDPFPVLLAAATLGPVLVLHPSVAIAAAMAGRLHRAGVEVASFPDEWAAARAGGTSVVGARRAALAPVPGLAAVVVLDAHAEAYQEERAPTWNAVEVAAERARRAGVPCVLVSPAPPLELVANRRVVTVDPAAERRGWPVFEVVDRRADDPRTGLFSERVVQLVRDGGRVVCVLNRAGRARLLACSACGELARCERCDAAVAQLDAWLVCGRCGESRPVVCATCGNQRLKILRPGVARAREELEALAGRPVVEITAASDANEHGDGARVLVGTEAVLHRVARADTVVFLDFDQELVAPRYRAAEDALGLLARAARMVRGRARGGRVAVQTRLPDHVVVEAARRSDPGLVTGAEWPRREMLRLPPAVALARVSGAGAEVFAAALAALGMDGLEVLGPAEAGWLVKAPNHDVLATALAATRRPPGRLRIEVDPRRV